MTGRGRTRVGLLIGLLWGTCLVWCGCQTADTFPEEGLASKPRTLLPPSDAPGVGIISPYLPQPYPNSGQGVPGEPKEGFAVIPDPAFPSGSAVPPDLPANNPPACQQGPPGARVCSLLGRPCPPGPKVLPDLPRELHKTAQPTYVIEPPDILLIDTLRVVPKPPYKIEPLDSIIIYGSGVLPDEPLTGQYNVEPDGKVILSVSYGSVQVAGMTIEEARKAIEKQLQEAGFKKAQVRVASGRSRAQQQIRGEHLVRPDGTIALGIYGGVFVAGFTLQQAKAAIEAYLSQYLEKPEVSVDVFSYNSKVYYIIANNAGFGEQVYRLPCTGNETVLDALSLVFGIHTYSSDKRIWLSRPAPAGHGCYQILPIEWQAITRAGATETNYQILPGDRIFVDGRPLVAVDTLMSRMFSPLERLFGITLLGNSTIKAVGTPFPGSGAGGAAGR